MNKIINCIIVDDEHIARDVLENHISRIDNIKIVATCKSALEAFNSINKECIDLIFLDINMPEISGLSFAKSINKNIKVIFTTAYREYAVDGFNLQAVDYLLKPISFERLLQAINKYLNENISVPSAITESKDVEQNDHFFVRSNRKMIKIKFDEIKYIESLSDYIKIHLKEKTVLTRETISNIEAKLPQNNFLRIHRSYIISVANIHSYTNEEVEVYGVELPISRSYKDSVLNKLTKNS